MTNLKKGVSTNDNSQFEERRVQGEAARKKANTVFPFLKETTIYTPKNLRGR